MRLRSPVSGLPAEVLVERGEHRWDCTRVRCFARFYVLRSCIFGLWSTSHNENSAEVKQILQEGDANFLPFKVIKLIRSQKRELHISFDKLWSSHRLLVFCDIVILVHKPKILKRFALFGSSHIWLSHFLQCCLSRCTAFLIWLLSFLSIVEKYGFSISVVDSCCFLILFSFLSTIVKFSCVDIGGWSLLFHVHCQLHWCSPVLLSCSSHSVMCHVSFLSSSCVTWHQYLCRWLRCLPPRLMKKKKTSQKTNSHERSSLFAPGPFWRTLQKHIRMRTCKDMGVFMLSGSDLVVLWSSGLHEWENNVEMMGCCIWIVI